MKAKLSGRSCEGRLKLLCGPRLNDLGSDLESELSTIDVARQFDQARFPQIADEDTSRVENLLSIDRTPAGFAFLVLLPLLHLPHAPAIKRLDLLGIQAIDGGGSTEEVAEMIQVDAEIVSPVGGKFSACDLG